MARAAQAVWPLAYDLHADEPRSRSGVLDWVFTELQREQSVRIMIEPVSLDSTMTGRVVGKLADGRIAAGRTRLSLHAPDVSLLPYWPNGEASEAVAAALRFASFNTFARRTPARRSCSDTSLVAALT